MSAVAFRRIGGRIVPIKQDRGAQVRGAALIGAGVAGGYGIGRVAAKRMHASALVENAAYKLKSTIKNVSPMEAKARLRVVRGLTKKGSAIFNQARQIRNVGVGLSAGAIGLGMHEIIKDDKHPKRTNAIAAASGLLGAFAVHSSYVRGLGTRGFKSLAIGLKRAITR